ncbi:type II secretion system protein [Campylobacter hyointestinalis]|uniref:type II secretion system protein n=1 Tax=Campylobacter hyointestinalis TaxID=198 RepID=UPI001BD5966A|nr:type II secretion system protein [Campylobacter hyointestinalis]MBT0611226.1 type II secretion system GspH family protein [Campylobacter hyointestinalis subsp. hyointestinalis]MDY2998358.1 type II secretion system protein [Campylobacter hyointestinalis]
MKKAFTMIELVFVIVIIAILASLALPKLVLTATDAKATSQAGTLKDVLIQLKTYYIANGNLIDFKTKGQKKWQEAIVEMSPQYKLSLEQNQKDPKKEEWIKCVELWPTGNQNAQGTNKASRAYVHVKATNDNSSFCKVFRNLEAVKKWISYENNGVSMADSNIFSDGSWKEDQR